ncbi:hypothetical protein OAN24_06410 [Pseudodesulfovibrio sp.]|nr:hypothetical protein [Pseudodesulfovibrio sp.]
MKSIPELIESAAKLPRPANDWRPMTDDFGARLAQRLDGLMRAETTIDTLVPIKKRGLMRENHRNHMKYMDSMVELFNPTLFVETVIWAMNTYRNHGFAIGYWKIMIPHCIELMRKFGSKRNQHVISYYQWIMDNMDSLAKHSAPKK